jgi:hypothetical protein
MYFNKLYKCSNDYFVTTYNKFYRCSNDYFVTICNINNSCILLSRINVITFNNLQYK